MAQRLGISISYLSQIESGDRPLTAAVVSALSRSFPLDWSDVTPEDGSAITIAALDAGTDPSIPSARLADDVVLRGMKQQPLVTQRMIALHAAFRRSQDQLRVLDDRVETGSLDGSHLPWEEVRDWFQSTGQLHRLARSLRRAGRVAAGDRRQSGSGPQPLPRCNPQGPLRRGSPRMRAAAPPLRRGPPGAGHRRAAADRDAAASSSRTSSCSSRSRDVMDQLVAEAPLRSEAARSLLRVGLANYAAGALLMPYQRFRAGARSASATISTELRHLFVGQLRAGVPPPVDAAAPGRSTACRFSSAGSTWPATSPSAIRRRGCNSPGSVARAR